MIRARHTFAGTCLARFCSGPLLDGAFREVRYAGPVQDAGLPILMLANHFCWWDGFIQYRINRDLYGRRLYVMMLEEELAKHPILARCGCFSVRRKSRSLLETLDYCAEVMRSPQNMLLIFPQGAIESLHTTVPSFRPGAQRLLGRIAGECQVLFDVNLADYGPHRKPALTCYQRMLPGRELTERGILRTAWERFYDECKTRHCAL